MCAPNSRPSVGDRSCGIIAPVTARRTALWIAAFLLGIAATFVLTADVKVGDANCGSALVPRDPTEISIDTGHPVDDEMRNSQQEADGIAGEVLHQPYDHHGLRDDEQGKKRKE